jgi:FAD/FMN-containing dehydrogenase
MNSTPIYLPSEGQCLICIRCGCARSSARHTANTWPRPPRGRVALAPDLGGTLSGEHGVGVLKRPYMEQALGSVSIDVQKCIKQALDPLNILNPGKVFPD